MPRKKTIKTSPSSVTSQGPTVNYFQLNLPDDIVINQMIREYMKVELPALKKNLSEEVEHIASLVAREKMEPRLEQLDRYMTDFAQKNIKSYFYKAIENEVSRQTAALREELENKIELAINLRSANLHNEREED